eukprot:6204353-Alexandrium_andersonii.AAC.1
MRQEICWASASCQPWSSYGQSKGCADRRSLPFALWLEERKYPWLWITQICLGCVSAAVP